MPSTRSRSGELRWNHTVGWRRQPTETAVPVASSVTELSATTSGPSAVIVSGSTKSRLRPSWLRWAGMSPACAGSSTAVPSEAITVGGSVGAGRTVSSPLTVIEVAVWLPR
jgi:hypothetical protein